MRAFVLAMPVIALAACQNPAGNIAGGAAIGAALDEDNRAEGAVIGGIAAAAADSLLRQASAPGQCIYRDAATGREYTAACPN